MQRRLDVIDGELAQWLEQDEATFQRLEETDLRLANQSRYIWKCGKYPVWQNTDVVFYSEAEEGFAAQKRELEKDVYKRQKRHGIRGAFYGRIGRRFGKAL